MAKKKKQNTTPHKAPTPPKKGIGLGTWIAGAFAVIGVIAVFIIGSTAGNGATAAAPGGGTGSTSSAPAEEAKYIGRLLPPSYEETSVAPATPYTSSFQMTNLVPALDKTQTSVSVADVVANKIVYFEYPKAGADPVPLIAYVKPSGKLFVGVSFCIPCKSKGQSIEADGTLRCSACGTKRDAETGVGISGACRLYPLDELPVTVSGGKIVIDNAALDSWTPQPLDRKVGA